MTPDEVKALVERLENLVHVGIFDDALREAATALLSLSREIEELRAQLAQAHDALADIAKHWPDSCAAKTARAARRARQP